jgi:DNA polymerase I-like protein with 3'-5' exonuclease and polymerase domains
MLQLESASVDVPPIPVATERLLNIIGSITTDIITTQQTCDVCGLQTFAFRSHKGFLVCTRHLDVNANITMRTKTYLSKLTPRKHPSIPIKKFKMLVIDSEFTHLRFHNAKLISVQYSQNGEEEVHVYDCRHMQYDEIYELLHHIIDNDTIIVGHHLSADLTVFAQYDIWPEHVFDTMIAAQLLEGYDRYVSKSKKQNATGLLGYKLKDCIARHVPKLLPQINKEQRNIFIHMDRHPELWDAPFDAATQKYIELDVIATRALLNALCEKLLPMTELYRVLALDNMAIDPVVQMQYFGAPVDKNSWVTLIHRFDGMYGDLVKKLYDIRKPVYDILEKKRKVIVDQKRTEYFNQVKVKKDELGQEYDDLPDCKKSALGQTRSKYITAELAVWKKEAKVKLLSPYSYKEMNPTAGAQVAAYFEYKYPDEVEPFKKWSDKKKIKFLSLDKPTRLWLLDEDTGMCQELRDELSIYHQAQVIKNLQSKCGVDFIESHECNGRIHGSYGTVRSGRLSSNDPNMQNFPKSDTFKDADIRHCFTVGKDSVLLCADYSQQELVVLAGACKDPAWSKALELGKDLYTEVAIICYGLDPKTIDRDKGGKTNYVTPRGVKVRPGAKIIMLARNYGMSVVSLANKLSQPKRPCSIRDADGITKRLEAAFPIMVRYQEDQGNLAKTNFRTYTALGRPRVLLRDYVEALAKYSHQSKQETIKKEEDIEEARDDDEDEEEENFVWEESEEYKRQQLSKEEQEERTKRSALSALARLGRNHPIQGGGADVTRLAMILFCREVRRLGLFGKVKLVGSIHDELLVESLKEYASVAGEILKSSMEKAILSIYPEAPFRPVTVLVGDYWQKD